MARLSPMYTAALLFLAVLALLPAHAEEVWALRTRFTVTMNQADIEYAEEDAQWRVLFKDGYTAADNMGFALELTDGTVIRNTDLQHDTTERSVVETPFGKGTRCHVRFLPKDGLAVEHSLTLFRERPFVLLDMAVTNTGETPATVRRFLPVQAGPLQLPGLGPSTEVTRYPLRIQAGEPVYDPDGVPTWIRFHDPATSRILALGVLPTGPGEGGVDFAAEGEAWRGDLYFDHSPGIELLPGARLETGSVWLAAGITQPEQVALYYGWACTVGRDLHRPTDTPDAWVTVADGQDLGDLLRTARAHQDAIRYALVPASWEGRPGSMRGAAPRFPADMGGPARQLKDLNVVPGIALDPLAGDGGRDEGIVTTPDGQTWLNPDVPETAELVRKRVQRALRWGYQFVAVAPSSIPDEALTAMGLSRARANTLALALAREAAGNAPVVVAGSGVPARGPADWRLAADAMKDMAEYGAAPAPMRIDADAIETLTEDGITALRDWGGPIEVVGAGKMDLRRDLERGVFAGRGGPPMRILPNEDREDTEETVEVDETDMAQAPEGEGDTDAPADDDGLREAPDEQPAQTAEDGRGRRLLKGIKSLGQSIF